MRVLAFALLVVVAIAALFGLGVFGLARTAAIAPIFGQMPFAIPLVVVLAGSLMARRLRY